jgi:dimethylaniline monooxygenase (N-oxide forming)
MQDALSALRSCRTKGQSLLPHLFRSVSTILKFNMAPTVAVIGAGPLGLSTIKNLTEDGFEVTGFEGRSYLGGVWKYSTDEHISVQTSTVFNSSKYRSAFTDYPFGDDVDDFPTWQQFGQYINDYADHFDVRKKVQINSYVESITREGKQWVLTIQPKDGPNRTEKFDKVVIANGYFTSPVVPKLEGIEKFTGRTLHAINFHHPEQYAGKNVLLIGLHATTQDVVKMLAGHAKQLYLSHRHGLLMVRINFITTQCIL